MKPTVWVLGDQLNQGNAALADRSPGDVRVLLVESSAKLATKRWHVQRLHLVLSAMAHFAAELEAEGFEVDHRQAASLVEGESWSLNLDLEVPATGDEPLRGRVLAMHDTARTPLPIEAAIAGEQRRHATLALPGYWLTPGRYVIEVRTRERSHLPLRRYVVEVR